jgi:galactose oxidase-like protein
LFGGLEESGRYLNDTWQLNGTEWTQIADTGPSGRAAHQMAYVIETKKIILFGGYSMSNGSEQLYGDTWEWDGSEWTQIADSGPSARDYHSMTYDSTNHVVTLFGGINSNRLGDTWIMSNNIWKKVQDIGPDPRCYSAMVQADTRTVLFGGLASTVDGTTWEWNGTNWIQRQDMGPSPRQMHSMAYDSERKRAVLFGGIDNSGILGDTWELKIQTISE